MKRSKTEIHRFFCPRCGTENVPLARKLSKTKAKGHLKKLYCYHCNVVINQIECRNDQEVEEFREKFNNGEYIELGSDIFYDCREDCECNDRLAGKR